MRTETDLRGAFALLERAADARAAATPEEAGHGVTELTPIRRREHSHRFRLPIAIATTAAAVAGLAVAAGMFGATKHPTTHQAATHSAPSAPAPGRLTALSTLPLRRLDFAVNLAGANPSGSMNLNKDTQSVDLMGPDGSVTVTVFSSRVPPPYLQKGARSLTVNGHRGVYAELPMYGEKGNPSELGVAWEYAPGAWATVTTDAMIDLPRATGVTVAKAVHVGTYSKLISPMKLSGTVAGLVLGSWNTNYGIDPSRAGQHGYHDWSVLADFGNAAESGDGQVTISASQEPADAPRKAQQVNVNGHRAYWFSSAGHNLLVDEGGYSFGVNESPSGPRGTDYVLSKTQMIQLAEKVSFPADPHDLSSWFDAADALP